MKNLQDEKLKVLKGFDGKELTKKELESAGISTYFIKIFMESEIISRVSRGVYKVSFTKNEKNEQLHNMFKYFNRFKFKVLDGKYIEAYYALMENFKLQDSHNYDNHMRVYFILLKELIGDNFDFSPLDQLFEFTEPKTDTYYDYFIDFREAVMIGNYYDAKAYLEKFAREEKAINGFNNISTTLFTNLIEDVLKKIEDSYNAKINRDTFNDNYKRLVNLIISGDYQAALESVEACIFSSKTASMTHFIKRIRMMLNDLLLLQNNYVDMKPGRADYFKTTNLYYKLDWAISAKDYYKARDFIDEILLIDERGRYKVVKRLIDAILKQIRDNNLKKEKENEVIDEETLRKMNSPFDCLQSYNIFLREYENGNYENALFHLEVSLLKEKKVDFIDNKKKMVAMLSGLIDMRKNNHGFEEMNIDYSKCATPILIFNKALDRHDYKVAFKNVGKVTYQNNSKNLAVFKKMLHDMYELDKMYGSTKENSRDTDAIIKTKEVKEKNPVKEIKVDENLIEEYVNNGRFRELYYILRDKKNTQSLNRLENVVFRLIKIYQVVDKGLYTNVSHVYEANENDHLGIFFEAIRCEDIYTAYGEIACIYGNVANPHEFEIFEEILRCIVERQDHILRDLENKTLKDEILSDINQVTLDKMNLTNEEIDKLYGYLEELQGFSDNSLANIMMDLVSMIDLSNNSSIDHRYFADLSKPEVFSEVSDQTAINNELAYLENGDYLNALNNIDALFLGSKKERDILKRLLIIFNNSLNKTSPVIKKEENKHIANIKRFIKKYDFYQAFNYIVENDLNDKLIEAIFPDIFDGMIFSLIMHEDIYKEFNEALKQKDFDRARIALINYKEDLDATSLGDSLSSKEKYEEMMKKLQK